MKKSKKTIEIALLVAVVFFLLLPEMSYGRPTAKPSGEAIKSRLMREYYQLELGAGMRTRKVAFESPKCMSRMWSGGRLQYEIETDKDFQTFRTTFIERAKVRGWYENHLNSTVDGRVDQLSFEKSVGSDVFHMALQIPDRTTLLLSFGAPSVGLCWDLFQ